MIGVRVAGSQPPTGSGQRGAGTGREPARVTIQRSHLVAAVIAIVAALAVAGVVLMRTTTQDNGNEADLAELDAGTDIDANGVPDALDTSITELAAGDVEKAASATDFAATIERAVALPSDGDGPDADPGTVTEAEAIARDMESAFGCDLDIDEVVVLRARVLALSLTTVEREQAYRRFDEMIGGIRHEAC